MHTYPPQKKPTPHTHTHTHTITITTQSATFIAILKSDMFNEEFIDSPIFEGTIWQPSADDKWYLPPVQPDHKIHMSMYTDRQTVRKIVRQTEKLSD